MSQEPTSAYPELPDTTAGMTGELILGAEIPYENEPTPSVSVDKPKTAGEIEPVYDQSTSVREARDAVSAAFEVDRPRTVVRESERAISPDEMFETVITAGDNISHARDYELAA